MVVVFYIYGLEDLSGLSSSSGLVNAVGYCVEPSAIGPTLYTGRSASPSLSRICSYPFFHPSRLPYVSQLTLCYHVMKYSSSNSTTMAPRRGPKSLEQAINDSLVRSIMAKAVSADVLNKAPTHIATDIMTPVTDELERMLNNNTL